MEQAQQPQEKKTPLTKEEFWRRLREHKRKKEELLQQIQQEMRARIKERTGEDVTSFEDSLILPPNCPMSTASPTT